MKPTLKRISLFWRSQKQFVFNAIVAAPVLMLQGVAVAAPSKKATVEPPAPAIEMGAPFADHAILQRQMEVPVWGWSEPGTEVTLEFGGQKKVATAGKDGKWLVKLDALQASAEPRDMVVREKGGATLAIKDVLVGEVWLASGQSNMQWKVSGSSAIAIALKLKEAAKAEGGQLAPIREFLVTDYFSQLHPIEHATGEWQTDYQHYSAVAFAFAHKLYEEIGVPIGILNCSFSQTRIEAWTPRVGYLNSKSVYNKKIQSLLLETDPSTQEHEKAWAAYYDTLEGLVKKNEALAAEGENEFLAMPNYVPGNMRGNRDATWLFNARLNPVVPFAIRGGIWNQGYANSGDGLTYYDNLHALVRGWRACWGKPEMPVYFHQFYSPGNDVNTSANHPDIGSIAEMRLGTWLARDIPNTGMASQIDVQGAIHYRHKAVPGQRLALHALKNQYGMDVVADGPMFKRYEVKGNELIITFDHAEGGLVVADVSDNVDKKNEKATRFANPVIIEGGDDQVRLFYLAGEDRVWHPAKVRIEGDKAVVSCEAVKSPRGVSYGTGGIGYQPNLYNKALLPTTPFIVYDNKLVTSKTWSEEPLKIAGVEVDLSTVGLIYEYRKMPILSTQFRDNAVFQADQPIPIWGSSIHDWGYEAKGDAIIHFSFDGIEKTIPVTKGMKQWKVVVPAMKASAEPKTLKVSLTIDGELAHERIVENILIGDVWYVAGLGDQRLEAETVPVTGPIRVITRESKGFKHPRERKYSVAVSTTPKNRFASYWAKPVDGGFTAELAKAIHAKTGRPVGIIYMGAEGLQLKHWMDVPSLANAPSLMAEYKDLAAITPGTPYYKQNVQRYIADWKQYWGEFIPEMIATKAVPDESAWGHYPSFRSSVSTDASQAYNCLVSSFRRSQLKGIVFMTEASMVSEDQGAHFGSEMSALANGLKRVFKSEKDPHFIYAMPSQSLAPKITKPSGIKGSSTAFELSAWPELVVEGKGKGRAKVFTADTKMAMGALIDAVTKAAD